MSKRQSIEEIGGLISYHPERMGVRDPRFDATKAITPVGYGFRYGQIVVAEQIRGVDRRIPAQAGRIATYLTHTGFSVILDVKESRLQPQTKLAYCNIEFQLDSEALALAVHAMANPSLHYSLDQTKETHFTRVLDHAITVHNARPDFSQS